MDTPTAMLMATTWGVAAFGKRVGLAGGILCAAGGLIPDLDTLLPGGTTEFITWHRGPTHSWLFLVVFTPLMAWIAQRCGAKASFGWLCVAAAWGLFIGIASDLITWWGTVVLWPLSSERYGLGLVFIIDLWHSAIVTAPFLAWGVQKLRGKTLPWQAFRVCAALSGAWLLLCGASLAYAHHAADELRDPPDEQVLDVLPQPFSPFRWGVVLGEADGDRRMAFIDHLHPGEVAEERRFPKTAARELVRITDGTDTGRLLRWFHRNSHVDQSTDDAGRDVLVYHDLSYEIRLPSWYGPPRFKPFQYRFVLDDGAIVDEGWLGR